MRSSWPTPSSTSGFGGMLASEADSVRTRWQKLWKFETERRALVVAPDGSLDPLAELTRGLHVVGEDEELLGEEVGLRVEEPLHALDDDAGLARAGARR